MLIVLALAAAPAQGIPPSQTTADVLGKPLVGKGCASPSADDIVVCGRRSESDRYRVRDPATGFDPDGPMMSVMRERYRWIEEGDTGIDSCSAVGPGGFTGCMIKQWNRQRQQREGY